MCTLVLLLRPDHDWPVLIAANRDEMRDRPWRGPGRNWPNRPAVVAGQDLVSGGSWCGLNDAGVAAAVLNRAGTLGPAPGKQSRGALVVEALEHGSRHDAASAVAARPAGDYRSFNLVVADRGGAIWLRNREHRGPGYVERFDVPPGLSMFTAYDRNAIRSARTRRHLPRFRDAQEPDPESGDWTAWLEILGTRAESDADPAEAMTVDFETGFATVAASLIALHRQGSQRFLFAPGPPDRAQFEEVPL